MDYVENVKQNLELLKLIMGGDNNLTNSEQLNNLIGAYSRFMDEMDVKVWIMSLIHKQVKKKYPNLSKEESMNMAADIFRDSKATSKINESIKKDVLMEARKNAIDSLLKAKKSSSDDESSHTKTTRKQTDYVDSESPGFGGIAILVGFFILIIFMLIIASIQ